jgi:stage III sporulation protein AD
MNDLKICGIIICCIVLTSIFKGIKNEYSLFIRIVITFGISILSLSIFSPIFDYIEKITKGTKIYEYLPSLIKILGIAIITELTSEICNDFGESGIASRISLFAQAEILVLTMPLIKELFSICQEIIN